MFDSIFNYITYPLVFRVENLLNTYGVGTHHY